MPGAIVIQARMGSSRSPGKISYPLQGEPMLEYQIKRLQHAGLRNICVATTDREQDDITAQVAERTGVWCFRGSESDVMGRYLACADYFDIDPIIRVGGDDPLLDPEGIEFLVKRHGETQADLVYASHPGGWIYGTAGELVTRAALRRATESTSDPLDREHVISFLKRSEGFSRVKAVPPSKSLIRPEIYLSVDYAEDLHLIEQILAHFTAMGRRYDFSQDELIALYDSGKLEIRNTHLHHGF